MNKLFSLPDATQQAMLTILQKWMQDHPLVAWVIGHPLLSVGILLAVVVLLRGLLDAIARLTERVWLAILRAPVRVANWLFTSTTQRFIHTTLPPAQPEQPTQQERLMAIFTRLEAIQQEQDTLLKEVRALLGTEPL